MREYFRVERASGYANYWAPESRHRKLSRDQEMERSLRRFWSKHHDEVKIRIVHVREEIVKP